MQKIRVAVLGPKGTHSHEAASKYCEKIDRPAKYLFARTNQDALKTLATKNADIAVVPIENSSAGLVSEVARYWMGQQTDTPLHVIAEVNQYIRHCLVVKKTTTPLSMILSVKSHPQALEQCRMTLDKLGFKVREPASSTAEAALIASKDPEVAAISSCFAAKIHGLKILKPDIQDFGGNMTRFHVVSHKKEQHTSEGSRAVVLFWVKNKPGALVKALETISDADLNMTSIHSIPLGDQGEYAFYVEFEEKKDKQHSKSVSDLLVLMRKVTERMIVLGSYYV